MWFIVVSKSFDNDLMNSIEPFDYRELKEYNHAYLSGFFAEKYDILTGKNYAWRNYGIEF